ncbi:protein translocase subunit SecF [Tessaracoccus rhinocerotis]|uniref:Protein-export membrane protein SecF n=1 Tax=Tessaracoccus rhinocerotis TaxID=1689449 RepID=A0A553JY47_9ACTN|nr:protein translocase subunit SecF [Tessaracoccus rhinocerotis]TRY17375.1 protein translocase subunit SecF [Tessaracoccus rhinocerotis]
MSATKMGLAHRLYTGQTSIQFIKNQRIWYIFSGVLLGIALLALLIRGLVLGIEFVGGTDFQAPMQVTANTVDEVRAAVDEFEVADLEAQVFALGDSAIRIQVRSLNPDETTSVRAAIAELAGATPEDVTYNAIGASWGQQVSQQAGIALVIFVVLVMLLIWAWFRDWKMSVAAVLALAHDVVITLGVYALVGFTVTPATLIGILTILGYSLYDTVVVFDKIKENVTGLRDSRDTYSERANLAINQVVVRSINTTIIGVLPVGALLIGGLTLASGPLQDLGLALFVGMIAGAYSSLFIAAPLLALLKEREPAQVEHRETIKRRIERSEAKEQRRAEREAELARAAVGGGGESSPGVASASTGPRKPRRSNTTRAERKKH